MKKTIIRMASLLILAISLFACTHNNGDIGPWFGQWKLESLTVNGQESAQYQGNIFWSFQTDVMTFIVVTDELEHQMHVCTWAQQGDDLLLDFRHHDDNDNENYYSAPAILGLQPQAVNTLHIQKLTSSHIILCYDSADGPIVYTLKKY